MAASSKKKNNETINEVDKVENEENIKEQVENTNKLKEAVVFNVSEEGKKIIEEFKEYLKENNKVSATIKSYVFDVSSFVEFIEDEGTTFSGEFNINQYRDFIKVQTEQNFKPSTINKRINSIQQFNIFLLMKKYMPGVIVILKNDRLSQ